jgi:hypothetical protein
MTDQTGGDGIAGALGNAVFRHEQSRQFAAYMLALPRRDNCPLRSAFDPVHILRLLPRIIIRERVADGAFRYRLLGTELQSYLGHDPTGQLVAKGVGDRAAGPLQVSMNRMMDHPCGLRCVISFIDNAGRIALLEYVSFPFSGVTPAQQISHVAILDRAATMETTEAAAAHEIHEMEGFDLGAGRPDFSDITL